MAEVKLWTKLKQLNNSGYHFRRQAPFRSYILDFVEHGARIAIEIDGGQHGMLVNRARDIARDKLLASEGYRVLRVWNSDIIENLEGVVERIVTELQNRPPTRPPSRNATAGDLPTRGR